MPGWYAPLLCAISSQSTKLEQDRRPQHKNTFVLKTYREAGAEETYETERKAYMNLRWAGKPSPHIISYYGGFVHGNSYNIILEYADKETLESFMEKTDPPSTVEDTLLFWNRFFDVTHGIMTIHGLTRNESSASQILNGYLLCPIRDVALLITRFQIASRHQTSQHSCLRWKRNFAV